MTPGLAGRLAAGALALAGGLVAAAAAATPGGAPPVVVDAFETAAGWSARPADGVELTVTAEPGLAGNALRLDFRFVKGGGYAVVHKDLGLDLPENYRFRFAIRGECLPNNLEFKLVDSTGANVWWANRRDFRFPAAWDSVTLKKRHIGFAWGPAGGGDLRRVAAIEFAVTAGSGGAGTVWLDQLTLQELPPAGAAPPPVAARATSAAAGQGAARAVDGDPQTAWRSRPADARAALTLDLGAEREFGGLVLDWEPGRHAADYAVEVSADSAAWRVVREVRGGNGGRDYLDLPESEARYLRLRVGRAGGAPAGVGLRELAVQPLEWAATPERFYEAVARDAPRGSYPRGITGEQQFWTVIGLDGGREEALFGEDGALESGKAAFSVEPFLLSRGKLLTWADVRVERWQEDGYLPIPTVRWTRGALRLEVTAFAAGDTAAPRAYARYRVTNAGPRRERATLYLALRPFQVNPPVQFLNTPGGTARLDSVAGAPAVVRVNGDRGVVCLTPPAAFGAAAFDQGDIVEHLRAGRLPAARHAADPRGRASGALSYPLDLAPGATAEVDLLIPLRELPAAPPTGLGDPRAHVAQELAACRAAWRARTERVEIDLPDSLGADVVRTLKAQLAFILVNRDGAGIQPGSRSYERSWIRDGSLTSSALLRLGQADVVRDFAEWFAGYQYADGKVPCCVDARGSDPVPEHDSSGQLIYLIAEYHRYTGDRGLAARLWPAVARAAGYLDSLRQLRRTDAYRAPDKRHFFGLLPPSISHEGYSAQPMHSYWDDLFALRGFKDAAYLAGALGLPADSARWAAVGAEFQAELAASLRAAMAVHRIDYLPGCADLGDFDATSTTVALDPVQADDFLPADALARTFEKYWEFFTARRDGTQPWEAYTPYEMRTIGAFVQLGWRERAEELLRFFLRYRRPAGWRQWGEVVWHDERKPHFIGDLPHTWVGSDYVRSVLDMLVYARERDRSLVLGAGVPSAWAAGAGMRVRGLATPYGELGFELRAAGDSLVVRIAEGPAVPPGGIVVAAPGGPYAEAFIDGEPAELSAEGPVARRLPAVVVLRRPERR